MEDNEFQQNPSTSIAPEDTRPESSLTQTPTQPKPFPFFIVVALILFGVLIGVLASRFLPKSETATNTASPLSTENLTPVATQATTPTQVFSPELTAEQDATLNPTTDQSNAEGKFCGGFAGIVCPDGYSCKYDGKYPDAGGVCTKK